MVADSDAEVLALDEKSKAHLREVARLVQSLRSEVYDRWVDAFLASPARVPQIEENEARVLIDQMVDLFVRSMSLGDFQVYYRGLAELGQRFFRQGLNLNNFVLALHCYEITVQSILVQKCASVETGLEAALALDALNDNAISVVTGSFFKDMVAELRERNRQLSAIYSIATTASQTLDIRKVLDGALDKVVETLDFDYAEVMLMDQVQQRLYPSAHRGVSDEFAQEMESFRVGEGLPGIVAKTAKPLFIPDMKNDPRVCRRLGSQQHLKSALGIPLLAQNNIVGVMNIFSKSSTPPEAGKMEVLMAVSGQIGLAIENARLYRQLRERADELAEAERRRQELMALVAHEFREPLTVILGYAQVLERGETKDQRGLKSAAETIVAEASRLSRLVDDMQDVSYIESGHLVMERERFDLIALAREIVRSQQATTDAHYLILRAPDEPVEGVWDRGRIAQALVNLLSNAIKYSPDGGRIIVGIEPHNHEVELTVRDEGIGIARSDFPQLFRPYSQLYRRQKVKGTGLGLYITIGIIKAHHGSLWVDSQVGKGTTFHISLPRSDPSEG